MAYPKSRFDEYISRFNAEDATAFDDFLANDLHVRNGGLEYTGVDGMKAHYGRIWPDFIEHLTVSDYLADEDRIAIRMHTLFTTRHDTPDSLFGPVTTGDTFEFEGLIMYHVDESDRFDDIQVAFNSFVHTDADGNRRDIGIPH